MTTREISCIEVYENVSGTPFCVKDLAWLNKSLAFTSHEKVLRAIRYCSEFPKPPLTPGFYLVKNGFEHVWNTIEGNKLLHSRAVGTGTAESKRRSSLVGSSRSENIDAKIRARRDAKMARAGAGSDTPPAPGPVKEEKVQETTK
jgi:hypothetical protein